jgi:dynein heavy chain, axonemal
MHHGRAPVLHCLPECPQVRPRRRAGGEGTPGVFLLSDSQIKHECFVEDVNNLLNSGEVPNMFPYDERAAILELCREASRKAGLALETPAELWAYFVDRTRANLHVALCMSPIGDAFRCAALGSAHA